MSCRNCRFAAAGPTRRDGESSNRRTPSSRSCRRRSSFPSAAARGRPRASSSGIRCTVCESPALFSTIDFALQAVFKHQASALVVDPRLVPDLAPGVVEIEAGARHSRPASYFLAQRAAVVHERDRVPARGARRRRGFDIQSPTQKSNCRYSGVLQGLFASTIVTNRGSSRSVSNSGRFIAAW